MTVGHAHGEVRVGCFRPTIHLTKSADVDVVQFRCGTAVALCLTETVGVFSKGEGGAIEEVIFECGGVGCFKGFCEARAVGEDAFHIQLAGKGFEVHVGREHVGAVLDSFLFEEDGEQDFCGSAVDFGVEGRAVFGADFAEFCGSLFNRILVAAFDRLDVVIHAIRVEVCESGVECHEGEIEVVDGIFCGFAERVDAVDDVFIFFHAALFGEGTEGSLFFGFVVEEVHLFDAFVHAAVVLNHVAVAKVLVFNLEAHGIALVHEFLVVVKQRVSGSDNGCVGVLCAQFDLRGGEIAACSAGESHNHGVVVFLDSFEGDGQEFVAVKRHVVGGVGCRLSVFVCVDSEDGEVCVLARPHPVVGVSAELSDVVGRRGNETHVKIGLFVEKIEAVGGVEGIDFSGDAFGLLVLSFFQHFFGDGFKEALALHGVDVLLLLGTFFPDLLRDIFNADDEGEGEALGGAQFFASALCEEAVLDVVVIQVGHLVDVGESAMVVGEDQSIGADDFSGATAAEDADAVAQRGSVFVVERRSRQLESRLAEGVFKMLLLHHFEEPHSLVSTNLCRKAEHHEEGEKDFFHFAYI